MADAMMSYAIAVDLGGTQVRAARVRADGEVSNRVALRTDTYAGPKVIMQQIADAAMEAARGLDKSEIKGFGISSPGPLNTETGVAIALPSIPGFENFPIVAALEEKLQQKVYLENDGISAAIGEWRFGAGQGLHSMVYVTVSTGIGGGVVVNNTVLRGHLGMAGHVGHLTIDSKGIRCNCGNTGCWERYAAGPFFAARAREQAKGTSSTLSAFGEKLQPADIFAEAKAGDKLAIAQVEEEARLLGVGLTSLLHLFSPQMIVIGGGLSNAFDQLRPGIRAYVEDNAFPSCRDVPIVTAKLGGNSGLIGAAAMVFDATI
jgi:glucokinase